jgi:hypothetical protein
MGIVSYLWTDYGAIGLQASQIKKAVDTGFRTCFYDLNESACDCNL